MSAGEFKYLMQGKTLINTTNHRKKGKRKTTSIGFCFFEEDPDEAVKWLSGIADLDFCVTFDVLDGYLLKTQGVYISPDVDLTKPITLKEVQQQPMIVKTEYCRTRYSALEASVIAYTDKYANRYPKREEQRKFIEHLLAGGRV